MKTVLIVEDSRTQALHLRTLLERQGLNVVWAQDGREGLEMARESHPDLIILDVQMPELDGLQTAQMLKESKGTANIPIILFTRHDDIATVTSGLQKGVIDFIPKDAFAEAVLMETLRQMHFIKPLPS